MYLVCRPLLEVLRRPRGLQSFPTRRSSDLWNAWSNAITAERPVATRAILTAFSTASAPELTSSDFVAVFPGHVSSRRRHTSTYGSYNPTIKIGRAHV